MRKVYRGKVAGGRGPGASTKRRVLLWPHMILFTAIGSVAPVQTPRIGKPATDAQIAAINLTVFPDGTGLPLDLLDTMVSHIGDAGMRMVAHPVAPSPVPWQ